MRAPALALALSLALPTAAAAQSCDTATTQADLNACAAAEWRAADADLNAAYQAAMAVMRQIDAGLPAHMAGAAASLRDAQRAWIPFRDAACAAEGFQVKGGTAEPMVTGLCLARLTRTRAEELWVLATQY